ncbi:MAG TPA: IS4 family transposase [Gemmataceae bacterium]
MAHRTSPSAMCQVAQLRDRFTQAAALPFADILPAAQVQQAAQAEQVRFRDRLFSPAVTLWMFLSQVLDATHCCRQAVARFLAWRLGQGLAPCSADTSAYCKARGRLPEAVLARLVRQTGQRTQDEMPAAWRWAGRTVKVVDGTTVSMPDTPANQQAFPQSRAQKAGVGFPLARMVVLFSLAVGTALDAAFGPYRGKQTGELSLFRQLHDRLDPGDILLADRHFCSFWELALVRQRSSDVVTRLHQLRKADFRRGRQLGPCDHVVTWTKPARPEWMTAEQYARLPDSLAVRELRVCVARPGYRTRVLIVATMLLDADAFPKRDVALLYRVRWFAELDLRALKTTLQMGILRGKTPGMVRKEIWAHLLAYNLIRGLMAQAASEAGLLPWQLSFAGAVQTVVAFAPLAWAAEAEAWEQLGGALRAALREHRVCERPGRVEPRAQKRRPQHYPLLMESRDRARSRLIQGRCA